MAITTCRRYPLETWVDTRAWRRPGSLPTRYFDFALLFIIPMLLLGLNMTDFAPTMPFSLNNSGKLVNGKGKVLKQGNEHIGDKT